MKQIVFVLAALASLFCVRAVFNHTSGLMAYAPFILLPLAGLAFYKVAKKFNIFGVALIALITLQSCTTVSGDKIGVYVENWGKSPEDYSVKMGTIWEFAKDTWVYEFPNQDFNIDFNPATYVSVDQVPFTVDPQVSWQLIATDEACRKWAFRFKYCNDDDTKFEEAVNNRIRAIVRDLVNEALYTNKADTILKAQFAIISVIETKLKKILYEELGIELTQFSMKIDPPTNLLQATQDRIQAEQALATNRAKLAAAEIEVKVKNMENQILTPQALARMRIEAWERAMYRFAESSNTKIVVPNDQSFLLSN